VSIFESFMIAFAAVRANLLRSILTLIGVIFGVFSVILIISMIDGFMASFEDSLSALGPETFVVTKFGIITSDEEFFDALKRKNFTIEDMRAVEKGCPDCYRVSGRAISRARIAAGNRGLRRVMIGGSPANLLDVIDFELDEGRYFTEAEYDHKNQVIFIGPAISDELFPGEDPIGKMVKVMGRKFRIIGVAKRRGSIMGENQDNFAFIPLSTWMKLFGKPGPNFNLMVKAYSVENIQETMDQVRSILRARRGVNYKDNDDFSILTADSILSFLDNVTAMIRLAMVAIASISLVVGGIVIMNIMMVAVSERTREIGIRKSIGARKKNIMMQFLFESLILSLGGGLIGTAVGIAGAMIIGSQISMQVPVSVFAVIAGISISTGVGVFFGLYPAMKAAKMDPIDALRFE